MCLLAQHTFGTVYLRRQWCDPVWPIWILCNVFLVTIGQLTIYLNATCRTRVQITSLLVTMTQNFTRLRYLFFSQFISRWKCLKYISCSGVILVRCNGCIAPRQCLGSEFWSSKPTWYAGSNSCNTCVCASNTLWCVWWAVSRTTIQLGACWLDI